MKNESPFDSLFSFCAKHAETMFHEPEACLTRHYLDPGGPYSKNLWDWDSFWAATALLGIADKTGDAGLREKTLLHAKGALLNFFDHQAADGSLPILLTVDCPDVFGSTGDSKSNMAKPVMGQFCKLLDSHGSINDKEAASLLDGLARFHECYRTRYLHEKTGLYLWANDIAIGVDDDPATWGRPPFSSASVYLNCLLFMDLNATADFAMAKGRSAFADTLRGQAGSLKDAINRYCLDKIDGLYYSVDVLCTQNLIDHKAFGKLNANLKPFWNCLPVKVACWTSFMPLWCGIADAKFADRMVRGHLMRKERFWTDYGVRSLAADERMYSPEDVRGNPSNWLGPVWIITNYVVWRGLLNYGFKKEADELAENTCRLLADDYRNTGLIHEYYSPETGKGISGPGFMNWNLLACLMKD